MTTTTTSPVRQMTAEEARHEAARLLRDVAALAAVAGVPCSAAAAEVHLAYATPPAGVPRPASAAGGIVIRLDRHRTRGARHAR